ncbi:MAG: DUF2157 domain-containing protein, partial [Micromonosporaceae bacterium]|nr:DUF2157 domain-containing protein [Micromonosporaceae bacterium]
MQPTVPDVSALLDRWVAKDIITAEQAEQIRADLAESRAAAGPARPVSLVAEGLGYLGGVIVVVGLLLVLGLTWETLSAGGKVGVAGGVAVAFAVAGALVPVARLGSTRARLRGVLWLGATIGVAAALGLTADELLGWEPEQATLALASGAAAVASAAAWLLSRHVLQHLSTLAALVPAVWNGTWLATESDLWSNLAVWGVGVVWFALALPGILPRLSGSVLGAITVTIGGLLMLAEDWGSLFALGSAVVLVAVAVLRRELAVLGVGSVATLIALPIAVDEYFPGVLPAALSLVAGGLALVAIAIL